MEKQKLLLSTKKCVALLCAFVFVIALVLNGCGNVKKVKGNKQSTSELQGSSQSTADAFAASTTTTANPNQTNAFVTAASQEVTPSNNTPSYNNTQYYGGNSSGGSNVSPSKVAPTQKSDYGNSDNSVKTGGQVYNDMAAQRKFGFNAAYDKAAGAVFMNICNVCTYFTYAGKDWLLEFWKGEYEFVTVGAEVGIYYHDNKTGSPPANPKLLHYKSAENEDALYMSMEVWQCDSKGERKVITMPRLRYWWMAAFSQGTLEKHSRRTDLVVVFNVEFQSAGMMDAFLASFKNKSFKQMSSKPTYKNADAYYVDRSKNTVHFSWRYLEDKK